MKLIRWTCAIGVAAALPSTWLGAQVPPQQPTNILVIVGDDIGVDRVGAYGYTYGGQPLAGPTPTLDALASTGILFRNAWSDPLCSPTRATALTGRYGFRTGIGNYVGQLNNPDRPGLSDDHVVLPSILPTGYRTAAVGKWHLADNLNDPDTSGPDHPIRCGFEYHAGSFANFIQGAQYDRWLKWTSTAAGSTSQVTYTYATTDTTNEAIGRIQAWGQQPWLLWVAYNAPHKPLHKPPPQLHTQTLPPGDPELNPVPHVKAMIEAMDTEIGNLLAAIPPSVMERTTVLFIGDNGTQEDAIQPPFPSNHGKGTPYNGGVNVPWIVAGSAVAPSAQGTECQALVNTTDIFATVAELAGASPAAAASGVDSVSTVPYLSDPTLPSLRDFVYAEIFYPNFEPPPGPLDPQAHVQAIRDQRYKLIVRPDGSQEFYDLLNDYHESTNLWPMLSTPEHQAYVQLRAWLAGL